MKHNCEPLIKAIDAYIKKADDNLKDSLSEAGFVDAEETVEEITRIEERVAQALKNQTSSIEEAVKNAVDLEDFSDNIWQDFKLTDDLDINLNKIFLKEFSSYIPNITSHIVTQIDSELIVNTISKRTIAWIESWSEKLGEFMKLDSHKEIENILVNGLKEGQSIAEFTQALQDSGVRDEYYKARRVALTEVLTAHSVAQQESFMQSPAVEDKIWCHTGSYRNQPRENHVAIHGQQVPVAAAFKLEGADNKIYYPLFPRDPSELPPGERINCHCLSQPIVSEDILGLSLEERKRLQADAIAADDGEWEKELDAKNKAKAGIE